MMKFFNEIEFGLQIRNTATSTTLEISLAFPEDSGTFTVIITNCMGETRASCKLTVREAPPTDDDFASSPPNITQPLKSRESMEGSKVRMDCVIMGRPEPEVCATLENLNINKILIFFRKNFYDIHS